MKPTTIFQAYIKANFLENHWRECRGSSFGIAVEKDEYALKFQKANRQAYFFEKRIRGLLSGLTQRAPDAAALCPECGEPFDFCAMGHYNRHETRRG